MTRDAILKIVARGYTSVTAFAGTYPTLSLADLAAELGNDLAGVQIFKVLVEGAERSHQLTRLVRATVYGSPLLGATGSMVRRPPRAPASTPQHVQPDRCRLANSSR